jgi:predicted DNA-binding protein (UPF0251 family)
MPRKQKQRKVFLPPLLKGFKAIGKNITDSVELNLDEYEVIKLLDYEDLNQLDAADIMGVSRPTLTRIYNRARKKIAVALAEGKNISISGGNVCFDENWFVCISCNISFNTYIINDSCPFCSKEEFTRSYNNFPGLQ